MKIKSLDFGLIHLERTSPAFSHIWAHLNREDMETNKLILSRSDRGNIQRGVLRFELVTRERENMYRIIHPF